jgi:cation diffusion facilitator family transporter
VIAIVISAFPLVKIWWSQEKGAAARAQFIESINDEVALFAALIGILLIANGMAMADGIAALVVAGVIATNAGILWWENAKNLMGHSPSKELYREIEAMARSVKGVVGVHDMRAEMIGGQVHLEMHVEVPRGTIVEEADRVAERVHAEIGKKIEHAFCTIHVDPAKDE